jgi:hypothetical protein
VAAAPWPALPGVGVVISKSGSGYGLSVTDKTYGRRYIPSKMKLHVSTRTSLVAVGGSSPAGCSTRV